MPALPGDPIRTAHPDHQPMMTGAGTPPFCTCGLVGGTGRDGRQLLADHLREMDPTYGGTR